MTFLLTHWRTIGLAVAMAAYSAFIWHLGGNGPRAELKAIQRAAIAYKEESARIAKEKDREYREDIDRIKSDWDAFRLRHKPAETVRVPARVCADDTANRELSDALSAYVGEVGRFRTGAEELLAECDAQREQLNCAVEWAGAINR